MAGRGWLRPPPQVAVQRLRLAEAPPKWVRGGGCGRLRCHLQRFPLPHQPPHHLLARGPVECDQDRGHGTQNTQGTSSLCEWPEPDGRQRYGDTAGGRHLLLLDLLVGEELRQLLLLVSPQQVPRTKALDLAPDAVGVHLRMAAVAKLGGGSACNEVVALGLCAHTKHTKP